MSMSKEVKSFTLIEVVIVIVIVGVLATGMGLFSQKVVIDSVRLVDFRSELNNEFNRALIRMSREIKMIKDADSINIAGTELFEFVDVSDNTVTYSVSGTELMRNGEVLCSYVDSLQFIYIDREGNSTTSVENVWLVKMYMKLKKGDEEKSLGMVVHPRNFIRIQ